MLLQKINCEVFFKYCAKYSRRYRKGTNADKTNFLIISRGSVFEYVAIVYLLKEEEIISIELFQFMYFLLKELSKMLFVMMQRLK